jgi:hypothetical protein
MLSATATGACDTADVAAVVNDDRDVICLDSWKKLLVVVVVVFEGLTWLAS